jgi:hypothetical protein
VARTFEPAIVDRLRAAEEVEIETSAAPGATRHRTIIWIVVDERDRVFIRSVRGAIARWYREAVAQPAVVLHHDGLSIPVTTTPAPDPERVAACSRALLTKYAGQPSTRAMVAERTLETTLELLPR